MDNITDDSSRIEELFAHRSTYIKKRGSLITCATGKYHLYLCFLKDYRPKKVRLGSAYTSDEPSKLSSEKEIDF